MGKWNQTVDVKVLLKEYEDKTDIDSLKELGGKIAGLLKSRLNKYIDSDSPDWDPEMEEVHDRFRDFDFDDVDEFDEILNDLYSLFDHYKILAELTAKSLLNVDTAPHPVELPDGTTRFIFERDVELDLNRFTNTLGDAIAYLAELALLYPLEAGMYDGTPYERAELHLTYTSPETDEEYANRLAEEERRLKAIADEAARVRDKAIQRRARSPRKLTVRQELALLADLKAKHPDA